LSAVSDDSRVRFAERWKDLDFRFLKIDERDLKLLDMLMEDSRRSNVDLAKDLEVSEATVRKRIKHLEDVGIITGYSANVDFGVVENPVKAYLVMKVDRAQRLGVIRRICQHPRSLAVYRTAGEDDILAVMLFRDADEFQDFSDRHTMIEGVRNASIHVVLTPCKGSVSSGV